MRRAVAKQPRPCPGPVRLGEGLQARREDARRPVRHRLMPISVTLEDLLRQRGMTLTELAERIDLTLANASILKTGKAKAIRFSTLEAICRELECQPGDVLRYEPE